VPDQFARKHLRLAPGTTYEIELHATTPTAPSTDDPVSATLRTCRPDPAHPRRRDVTDAAGLRAALSGAQAGDVITIAEHYTGTFALFASGYADESDRHPRARARRRRPDGGGCAPCNVLEVYGSFVHGRSA